jgi:predicted dehydrogenase
MKKGIIQVGIIGTGNAAQIHLEAFQSIPGTKVAALAGRDFDKTQALIDKFGIDCKPCSFNELIDSSRIDAVVIALPPFMQHDLALRAFQIGKHVLCEKPLGVTLEEAEAIYLAWKKSLCVGMVNFCYRLIPQMREFRRCLAAGDCGSLHSIHVEWVLSNRLNPKLTVHWKGQRELGGGVLQNYGMHVVDYLFYDRENIKLLAAKQNVFMLTRPDEQGSKHNSSGDEVATVLFDIGSGTVVNIHLSLVTKPALGHCVTARGSKGTLQVSNLNPRFPAGPFSLYFFKDNFKKGRCLSKGSGNDRSMVSLFRRLDCKFIQAILNDRRQDIPTIEHAWKASKILHEIEITQTVD